MQRAPASRLLVIAAVLWVSGLVAGFRALWAYSQTPGPTPALAAGDAWPSASRIARGPGRPALVVFLHPRCPCSRASVNELGKILTQLDGRASIHVLLVRPNGAEAGFEATALRERAIEVAGA